VAALLHKEELRLKSKVVADGNDGKCPDVEIEPNVDVGRNVASSTHERYGTIIQKSKCGTSTQSHAHFLRVHTPQSDDNKQNEYAREDPPPCPAPPGARAAGPILHRPGRRETGGPAQPTSRSYTHIADQHRKKIFPCS
jgi:hypothetical protein